MPSPGKRPKVLVTILEQGWLNPRLAILASVMMRDERADVTVKTYDQKPSETNRNMTALDCLQGGYDFLISIDHDMVPLRNPVDLVFMDLDIVGFAYPQWNMSDPKFPIYFVSMDKSEGGYTEHKEKEGLQEVDAVGSGCICVARRVLERIKAPFVRQWDADGIATLGLDFWFCERSKEAGFKVFCHYEYLSDHMKEISLLDVLQFKQS